MFLFKLFLLHYLIINFITSNQNSIGAESVLQINSTIISEPDIRPINTEEDKSNTKLIIVEDDKSQPKSLFNSEFKIQPMGKFLLGI